MYSGALKLYILSLSWPSLLDEELELPAQVLQFPCQNQIQNGSRKLVTSKDLISNHLVKNLVPKRENE